MYSSLGTFKGNSQFGGGADVKVDAFGVGGAWRPQFGASWGGVLRGGAAYVKARTNYISVGQSGELVSLFIVSRPDDSWHPYLGVGATYAVTANLRLEADLDATRIGTHSPTNVNTVMLGATFGF